jgi:hypothetical protein
LPSSASWQSEQMRPAVVSNGAADQRGHQQQGALGRFVGLRAGGQREQQHRQRLRGGD